MKKIIQTVSSWSTKKKVIAIATTACVLFASIFGGVWYSLFHRASEEIVEEPAEEVIEEVVVEEEEEVEEVEEILMAEASTFEGLTMTYTSIEKDIDLYFLDSDGAKITGHEFKIKLVSTSDAKSLAEYTDEITSAREELSVYEEEHPEIFEDATDEEVAEYELIKDALSTAILNYATALDGLSGNEYSDTDQNGAINEENMTAGDFVACFVPVDDYLASNLCMNVTIKEQMEYTVVDVAQKTVEYEESDDAQSEDKEETVEVEAVPEDTVDYVESKVVEVAATYEKTNASVAGLAATNNGILTIPQSETVEATIYSSTVGNTLTIEALEGYQFISATIANSALATIDGNVITAADTADGGATYVTVIYTMLGESTDSTDTEDVTEGDEEVEEIEEVTTGFIRNLVKSLTALASKIMRFPFSQVTYVRAEETYSIQINLTVVGSSTPMTDSSGNALYLDENGTVATVGNYSSSSTYYVLKEEAYCIYYGWQILDGTRYYFDANGKVVTGEQVINGVTYKFGSDGSLLTSGTGIDVSKWQGTITWSKVATTASFAIIRCGYRGSSTHGLAEDPTCRTNVTNAKEAGVKVGLYFYSLALTKKEAVEEASFAVAIANELGGISYPIFIDMEDSSQLGLTNKERDAIVKAFCKTVVNAGYQAGVYANKNWLTNYLTPSSYSDSYFIWCAQYNTECTYKGRFELWQYTSSGSVPGITGNVDMNVSYFDY